uniref:Flagellin n=1 Tax=Eubacterium plexicaudatum ASF492 TaxID=1235802 RepID=N2B036_9FIRM
MAIITHNLMAMNTDRQLGIVSESKKKNTEKLSSGYRINRSADDAAGLQISEKMRYQIRGLNKASTNIQDGISLIQTADGALTEVHDILQRMNELSTQAANDINKEEDREAIHKELLQLKSEINRTSKDTMFNTQRILWAKQLVEIDSDDYSNVIMDDVFTNIPNHTSVHGKTLDFKNVTATNKEELIGKKFTVTCSDNCSQEFVFQFSDQATSSINTPTGGHSDIFVNIGVKDANIKNGSDIVKQIFDLVNSVQGNMGGNGQDILIGHANGVSIEGSKMIFYSTYNHPPYAPNMGMILANDMLKLEEDYHLQVNDRPFQEITLKIRTINSGTLGLGRLDVDSFENAGKTMDDVKNAIDNLSEYRAYLGAMQNRLEKAMSSVENTSENTQRSESKLRDTDMAEEMVNYSKNKIIEQFGQVMLAQVNKNNDGIASLLA